MEDLAIGLLRATMGAVFVAHGWPKIFRTADTGHGPRRTENLLRGKGVPYPAAVALVAGYVETLCGLLLVVGLLTRVAVIPLILILILAIPMVKWKQGFVDGWDWPFTLIIVGAVLLVQGPGGVSIDALVGWAG